MAQPKSFKGGLVLTDAFVEQQVRQTKAMRLFTNALRCPICGSQLDGEANGKKASLYCVADPKEYIAHYNHQRELTYCCWSLDYYPIQYQIVHHLIANEVYRISLWQYDLNLISLYRQKEAREILSLVGPLCQIECPIDEEALLNELKLMALLS